MIALPYKALNPFKYYIEYFSHNVRPDGRTIDQFRPTLINFNTINSSDGSATVKVGRTTVICGIKAELCEPKATEPDQGYLIPNVNLPSVCSQKFKPGPPNNEAQITTKFVYDILQNSMCINLKDLCISKGHLVWCLYADIVCIDYDGSIVDACLLALIAALKNVTLPTVEYDMLINNIQVNLEERKPLTIVNCPIATSFSIFNESILLIDPIEEEEKVSPGLLIIVINNNKICSILKPGGPSVDEEKLIVCIEQAKQRTILLNNLLASEDVNK